MVPTTKHCQQISRSRWRTYCHLTGILVGSLCCLGCWEEVHFQSDRAAPATQKVPVVTNDQPSAQRGEPLADSEALSGDAESPAAVEEPTADEPLLEEVAELPPEQTNETAVVGKAETEAESLDLFGEEVLSEEVLPEEVLPDNDAPARTALATWQMCSKWSMAVALQAKGRDMDSFGERLEQAKYGARLLEVQLPELPTHEQGVDRLAANLVYLLEDAGPQLADELNQRYDGEHASLAELATKTHILLLSYTPTSTRLMPVVTAIRQAAESSGLPESVWRELIDLLEARADFSEVKAAIFQLHKEATAYLGRFSDDP